MLKTFFHPVAVGLAKLQLKGAYRHFFIFIICLVLGVSVITTVNLFSNLTQVALNTQSKSLLGGDVEVTSRTTIPIEVRQYLSQYGDLSFITTTSGMLVSKNQKRLLVSIKAIDDAYPLYGEFRLKSNQDYRSILDSEKIVVDSALLAQLGLEISDKVRIGSGTYTIVDEIEMEPDRVVQTLNFGPRVIMNRAGLEKSGLVSALSLKRDRYRIKFFDPFRTDSSSQFETFKIELQEDLDEKFNAISLRVRDENNQSDDVTEFIDKLTGFINLLGIGIFLIAGIGIASSTRAYLAKTYQTVAILKVQGANQTIILQTYGIIIGILAVISALIGIMAAYLIYYATLPFAINLMPILEDQRNFDFASPLLALWYSLIIAFLFSIPSLMNLHKMKAANFFRQKIYAFNAPIEKDSLKLIFLLAVILIASNTLTASDPLFSFICIVLMIVGLLLFVLLANLSRLIAKQIKVKSLWLTLALSSISENKSNLYIVVLAIGMSLSILFTLNLTEANFNHQIEQRSLTQIPDLFMIDIQTNQKNQIEDLLSKDGVASFDILPLVRGKITHIKGVAVEELTVHEEIDWALRRDRGISYSDTAPKNARISMGSWWNKNYQGKPLASVDERLMNEMNLKIGDQLTIQILNESFDVSIGSARKVDYASFQINFFLMLSPNAVEKFPHSFISTVNLIKTDDNKANLNNRGKVVASINDNFPNISIVQTEEVINIIQQMVDNIAIALRIMASLSIVAGFLILVSVLSANIQDRFYETAIYKAIGANWSHIIKVHLSEWLILCTITCFVAIFVGVAGAYLIDLYFTNDFSELGFYLSPTVILNLSLITYAIVSLIGYLGLRKIFQINVSNLLRND